LVFFAGGADVANTTITTADVYDSRSGQWSVTQLTQGGPSLVGAAAGPVALFAGGIIRSHPDGRVELLDLGS
jgi:hypothetical protein